MTASSPSVPPSLRASVPSAVKLRFFALWSAHLFDGRLEQLDLMWGSLSRLPEERALKALDDVALEVEYPSPAAVERAVRRLEQRDAPALYGAWKPPAPPTAEQEAWTAAVRAWAEGMDDATHERLRGLATRRLFRRWATRDLRETPAGRAILLETARLTEPTLLPLALREDVDTRGKGTKGRSHEGTKGQRRTA